MIITVSFLDFIQIGRRETDVGAKLMKFCILIHPKLPPDFN
jgi:hypothetical protein